MQVRRKKDGLPELPCKPAFIETSSKVVKVINPDIKVTYVMAPPDLHPDDLWCEIHYELG